MFLCIQGKEEEMKMNLNKLNSCIPIYFFHITVNLYFVLKCLEEFSIKAWNFLLGRIFFNRFRTIQISVSSFVSFTNLHLLKNIPVSLSYQLYQGKVVHNIYLFF